jgi:hypothetical protein
MEILYTESFEIKMGSQMLFIKSRRMRWAGHVARMGEKRNVYRSLIGKLEGKDH